MRLPGWAFIAGVLALVGVTALCSILSFGFTRQMVIDLGSRGVQVEKPWDLVGYVLRGAPTAAPQADNIDSLTPPTATPVPTLVMAAPTAATSLQPGATLEPTDAGPTATLDPLKNATITDPRRITILLLGIDQRTAVEDRGPYRTDTMILISIDPVRKTVGVLSIPRDLWVDIPGFQPNRINTANALGDSSQYPGGGPALAAATVQENLGVKVNKYLLVNFHAFTTIVDTLAPDGVEICIKEAIDDPKYPDAGYGTIHVHFDPGCQKLDAEHLLEYARTRATFGGDFDRARRQQEVLDKMRAYVLSVGGVRTFITQIPTLYDQLKDSFKTNLSLEEIINLGQLMSQIPSENIHYGVIDNLYVTLRTTQNNEQVLIPKQNSISALIQQLFNPTNYSLAELRTRAEAENAKIVVFNNTDIPGLAGQTREWLGSRQVNVGDIGSVQSPTNDATVIRNYTDKPWTARYLAVLLGIPPERIQPGADGATTADIMVMVGPDIQPLLKGETPGGG
jgi:LCP family protein required for cell wall assembly